MGRVVESIDVKARLGEEMCMSPLSAGNIEEARAHWERQEFEQPGDFTPVLFEREDGLVLEQVLLVEIGRPPFVVARGGALRA
jgi:hypothetical protein